MIEIPPRSGAAFHLGRGQTLTIVDPMGEQVADLLAFSRADPREAISSGRSLDYAERIWLGLGDAIYSNRSRVLLRIIEDAVGRHDFLLTPCSADTFRILYGDPHPHRGCFGNLVEALAPFGIEADQIPVTFNVFMNVVIEEGGRLAVKPPLSRAGDRFVVRAEEDLIVGLTACSAPQSNNFSFKPIHYEVSG